MNLDEWLATLAAEIGVEDVALDPQVVRTLLDVARDSAHNVTRVAAPLTTYLVGVAVGRGASLEALAATTSALAERVAAPVADDPRSGRAAD